MDFCKFHPVKPSNRCRVCSSLGRKTEVLAVPQLELKKPEKKHGLMPIWGDKNTWNISALMRKNVMNSGYFNELFPLRDLGDIVFEVQKHVKSIEPWIAGTCHTPTTLFCCLIKLFIMKLTEGQLRYLCDHQNPYTNVLGFLYIRFLSDPQELWDRFNYYTLKTTEFESTPGNIITISQYIEKILTEQDYFGLQLPRIPGAVNEKILKKCAQLAARKERFQRNLHREFIKDSKVFVYLDDVEEGIFKHKEGTKAHIQVNGVDVHVSLGDIDDKYSFGEVANKPAVTVFAESRKEYMKPAVSYKNALMFQISEKRPHSPSPEILENFAKTIEKPSETQEYSLEAPYKKKCPDVLGPEYLKLG